MEKTNIDELTKYSQAIKLIQESQEKIIGETIAKMIINNIQGLKIDKQQLLIDGDPKAVLEELVNQYKNIFGKASIMVSKEAIKKVNPSFAAGELPDNLK